MDRKTALQHGYKTYQGKQCTHCGSTIKYVSSFSCKPCNLKRNLHKLYDDDLMAQYRTTEKVRKKQINWRKNNPEKVAEQRARIDPAKRRQYTATYGMRKKNQMPEDASIELIQEIYNESVRLTEETGVPHEVDHIIPVSKGGLHHQDNLQILTRTENRKKSNTI